MEIKYRGKVFETNSSSTHAYMNVNRRHVLFLDVPVSLYSTEEVAQGLELLKKHKFPFTVTDDGLVLSGFTWNKTEGCTRNFLGKKAWNDLEDLLQETSWVIKLQFISLGLMYMNFPGLGSQEYYDEYIAPTPGDARYPKGLQDLYRKLFNRALQNYGVQISKSIYSKRFRKLAKSAGCWKTFQTSNGLSDELSGISTAVINIALQPPEIIKRVVFSKEEVSVVLDY